MPHGNDDKHPFFLLYRAMCCSSYDDIVGVYECHWSAIAAMEEEIADVEAELLHPCREHVRNDFWIMEGNAANLKDLNRDSYLEASKNRYYR